MIINEETKEIRLISQHKDAIPLEEIDKIIKQQSCITGEISEIKIEE